MLQRIFWTGLLTGLAQVGFLLYLRWLTGRGEWQAVAGIGLGEAWLQAVVSVIGFGLQSDSMRRIAVEQDWRRVYAESQQARLTFSLLLSLTGLVFLVAGKSYAWVFLLAPVLALSGDYALYALGKPVWGALFACLRTLLPLFFFYLLIANGGQSTAFIGFVLLYSFIHLLSSILICRVIQVPFLFRPRAEKLKLYIRSLYLGIVNAGMYIPGLGLLLLLPSDIGGAELSILVLGLKVYVVYKGVLRILQQAFMKDLQDETLAVSIDRLSLCVASVLALSIFLFPRIVIQDLLGLDPIQAKPFFYWLASSALVYAAALSLTTRALLEKRDRAYANVVLLSVSACMICLYGTGFFLTRSASVGISLLLSEIVFTIGLIYIMRDRFHWKARLSHVPLLLLLAIIPWQLNRWMGETMTVLLVSTTLFTLLYLLINRREWRWNYA